ncbi:hypothetical protein FRB97_009694 [Tulasnella sp. 331]|nr:hypothetical protein FRB97_009694 [Tulasnella sp. 331]
MNTPTGDPRPIIGSQGREEPRISVNSPTSLNLFDLLPTELIVRILALTTLHNLKDRDTIWPIRRGIPWPTVLSEVCKTWRDIVLDAPQVWTTAAVIAIPKSLSILEEHLKHSKGLTLHLDLFAHDQNGNHGSIFDFCTAVTLRLPSTARFRTLRIIGSSSIVVIHAVMGACTTPAWVSIEGLELVVHGENRGQASAFVVHYLGDSARRFQALRSIVLTGFRMGGPLTGREAVSKIMKLEKLHLRNCDAYSLHALCTLTMPALVTLAIDCSGQPVTQPITHSILQRTPRPLPSVRFIALYHLSTLFDLRLLLKLAPNATHLALFLDSRWRLKHALNRRLRRLVTLSLAGPFVTISEVGVALRARSENIKIVETSTAVLEWSNSSGAGDLEWLQAHTSLRLLNEEDFDMDAVLERWEHQI